MICKGWVFVNDVCCYRYEHRAEAGACETRGRIFASCHRNDGIKRSMGDGMLHGPVNSGLELN